MNYDISILELKLFLMTAQLGNYSEVSRQQGMTPSSVSRKMAQLEGKVGTKLLHRHTRAISLTDEGTAFAKYCSDIVRQYELVCGQIEQRANTPRGVVKISAPVAFGRLHIAPYIPDLLELYPLLRIEMQQTDSFIDPAKEGIDLLIRIGALQDSGLKMNRFGNHNFVLAASPEYLRANGVPETPEQLIAHNCLVFKGTNGLQRWFIGKDGLTPYEVKGSLYSNNAETLVSSAIGGAGVVMFPTWLINEEIRLGKLVPILTDYRASSSAENQTINALYLPTDNLAPKVRVVIDFLKEKYGSPCYWDAK
ncbi:LysR family transcriptional regulator [Microbulbifer sp. TRSA002]|uniref:LysR family transcriptional regulator n=1 Tax=unclassified Microbulbifer TaxID=2619833 RepID=UPI0040399866